MSELVYIENDEDYDTDVEIPVLKRHCGKGTGYPKLIKIDCTASDSYNYYKKNVPKKLQVESRKVYMSVIKLFFKKFMDKIIYGSDELKLPMNMGTLCVKKLKFNAEREVKIMNGEIENKIPNHKINWKLSKQVGKKIPYVNEHTDYDNFKFLWNKSRCQIVNKTLYTFRPIRANKRLLAKAIIELKKDYF